MRLALRATTAVALALLTVPAAGWANAEFTVSPASPLTLEAVTFTAESSSGSRSWDLDGDGFDDGSGQSATRSFPVAGRFPVALRVVQGGSTYMVEHTISVANRAPSAVMGWFPASPVAGQPVSLVSTSQDLDGQIVSEQWDLDADGAFDDAGGRTAARTFPTAGAHTVRLRAVDDRGAESVAESALIVTPRIFPLMSPFPTIRLNGTIGRRGTLVRRLVVSAPPGATVEIRCAGPGCRAKKQRRSVAGASSTLRFPRFERRLRPRASLRVYVTKPDTIGKYSRFWFRRGRAPARRDLCLAPGTRKPVACPAR